MLLLKVSRNLEPQMTTILFYKKQRFVQLHESQIHSLQQPSACNADDRNITLKDGSCELQRFILVFIKILCFYYIGYNF